MISPLSYNFLLCYPFSFHTESLHFYIIRFVLFLYSFYILSCIRKVLCIPRVLKYPPLFPFVYCNKPVKPKIKATVPNKTALASGASCPSLGVLRPPSPLTN